MPQARLLTVFPPGAPAGSTNEINVTGTDLEDPAGLLISDPRLHAERHPSKPGVFSLFIPSGVEPGLVDIRWTGRFGVSNPRVFAVGTGPEWILNPTNTTASNALELPLSTVVNGRMPPNQTLWFRVTGTPGDRFMVRVQSRELESRLEPGLRLLETSGKELSQARLGFLDGVVPTSGACLVQLRDVTYRGGDDFGFRLVLSRGPHLDFALPGVLRAGETNRVTVFGRNLAGGTPSALTGGDGHSLEQRELDIVAPAMGISNSPPVEAMRRPAVAVLSGQAMTWRLVDTNGTSNPLLFTLTPNPVVVVSAASPPSVLTPLHPPAEFSGLFPRRGGLSGVTFEARKGDVYWMELWADRLGFPCDPFAVVQREQKARNEKGEAVYVDVLELGDNDTNLGGNEFNTVTRDPVGRFAAPEDGTYRVLVRDLFHTGATAPRYPYQLSIRRESPDFVLVALPPQPIRANDNDRAVHPVAPFLRRDGTELLRVIAFRRDGFNGDIDLRVEGLDPGLEAAASRIPSGQTVGFIPITAGTNASGVRRPMMFGRASLGTNLVEHRVLLAVSGPAADFNEQVVPARCVREPMLSVSEVESAPVTLVPPFGRVFETTADGKLSIPLEVIRRGEFTGAFNVKLAGRSELEKTKEASIPEKATHATVEISIADAKLPEGLHRCWLQGQSAGKYRNNPEALAAAESDLKVAEDALKAATPADKAALEQRKKVAEELKKAAEERAKPRDVTVRVVSRPFEVRIIPPPKTEAKP